MLRRLKSYTIVLLLVSLGLMLLLGYLQGERGKSKVEALDLQTLNCVTVCPDPLAETRRLGPFTCRCAK